MIDIPQVSPLRATPPVTEVPMQTAMFAQAVSFGLTPLAANVVFDVKRLPKRGKCRICERNRVLVRIIIGDSIEGPSACFHCAGLR